MIRATKSMSRLCARASSAKLSTVPSRLKISTGRRPQRSERSPSTGAATNCASEKAANSRPMVVGDAPKVCA